MKHPGCVMEVGLTMMDELVFRWVDRLIWACILTMTSKFRKLNCTCFKGLDSMGRLFFFVFT